MAKQMNKTNASSSTGKSEVIISFKDGRFATSQVLGDCYKDPNTKKIVDYIVGGEKRKFIVTGTMRLTSPADDEAIKWLFGDPEWKDENGKTVGSCGFMKSKAWIWYKDGLVIENKLDTAKRSNEKREKRTMAESKLLEMINAGREMDVAFLLGIFDGAVSNNMDKEILISNLYTKADSNPEMLLASLSNPDIEIYITLKKGLFHKFFRIENSIIKYNDAAMGMNEERAVEWLKLNPNIYSTIKTELDKIK